MGDKWNCTPDITAELCKWLEHGATVSMACDRIGLPPHVYYDWRGKGTDLTDDLGNVVQEGEEPYRTFVEVVNEAKDEAELQALTKIRTNHTWQSAAWFLERTRSNDYSRASQKHEHTIKGKVNIVMPSNGRDEK